MNSLKIDSGVKSFCINDDPSRVIRFNPSDVYFAERFYELVQEFKGDGKREGMDARFKRESEKADSLPEGEKEPFTFNLLREMDTYFREKLDYAFGEGTSEAAFGNVNIVSRTDNGQTVLENFLDAVSPVIAEARSRQLQKHTAEYKK